MIKRGDNAVLKILEHAMESEKEGYAFYVKASSITNDPKGKEMFKYLARDETEHFKTLEKTYSRLGGGGEKGTKSGGRKIKGKGFVIGRGLKKKLEAASGDLRALNIALQLEEDAKEFYAKSAKKTRQPDVRDIFLKLSDMESSHYQLLKYELDSLTRSGYWCDFPEFTLEETE